MSSSETGFLSMVRAQIYEEHSGINCSFTVCGELLVGKVQCKSIYTYFSMYPYSSKNSDSTDYDIGHLCIPTNLNLSLINVNLLYFYKELV